MFTISRRGVENHDSTEWAKAWEQSYVQINLNSITLELR